MAGDELSGRRRMRQRQKGNRFGWVTALLAGAVLGILVLSAFAHFAPVAWWDRLDGYVIGRGTHVDVSSPAVVEKIHKLARLESVVYTLDKLVEGDKKSNVLPDFLAGDKLLLMAHGDVVAGIDLSQLKPDDVFASDDKVFVRLPPPEILSTRLDSAKTRVYSRTTGLLVPTDPNLESKVRETAETQIKQAALDDGILLQARDNARTSITALLFGLGFHSVEVQ